MIKDAGYTVRISCLEEEDGGGWLAEIPELDGCFSDGDTPQEALQRLEEVFALWMQVAAEEGIMVPNPVRKSYSDSLTPRRFEQLLYEAEKRGLVSRRAAVGESESKVKIKHLKPGTVFNAGRSREGEQDEAAEKSDI